MTKHEQIIEQVNSYILALTELQKADNMMLKLCDKYHEEYKQMANFGSQIMRRAKEQENMIKEYKKLQNQVSNDKKKGV